MDSTTTVISGRGLRRAGSAAHEAAPALTLAAARSGPLGARSVVSTVSVLFCCARERKCRSRFFPASRFEDGTLGFSIDPVFLTAVRVDDAFYRDLSANAVFYCRCKWGICCPNSFQHTLCCRGRYTCYSWGEIHEAALLQPRHRPRIIFPSPLPVVLVTLHATPRLLLYQHRLS